MFIREAHHQNFGHEFADLFRREVYNGGDLFAGQLFQRVMLRYLRRGSAGADFRAEVDGKFKSRLARFRIGFGRNDCADTNVDT